MGASNSMGVKLVSESQKAFLPNFINNEEYYVLKKLRENHYKSLSTIFIIKQVSCDSTETLANLG
jgi:hypothetical protein